MILVILLPTLLPPLVLFLFLYLCECKLYRLCKLVAELNDPFLLRAMEGT
jgi:hypothetical protein